MEIKDLKEGCSYVIKLTNGITHVAKYNKNYYFESFTTGQNIYIDYVTECKILN